MSCRVIFYFSLFIYHISLVMFRIFIIFLLLLLFLFYLSCLILHVIYLFLLLLLGSKPIFLGLKFGPNRPRMKPNGSRMAARPSSQAWPRGPAARQAARPSAQAPRSAFFPRLAFPFCSRGAPGRRLQACWPFCLFFPHGPHAS